MNKKISTTLAFSVIIILAIFLAGISFYLWRGIKTENSPLVNLPKKNKIVACTEEAKICPDGSAVGRTAPNCEFAPCLNKDEVCEENGGKYAIRTDNDGRQTEFCDFCKECNPEFVGQINDSMIIDWKEYRNEKLGFKIEYPSKNSSILEEKLDIDSSEINVLGNNGDYNVEIAISKNTTQKTDMNNLQSVIVNFYGESSWPFKQNKDSKIKEFTMDNYPAIRRDYIEASENENIKDPATEIFTLSPRYIYRINYMCHSVNDCDKILSTFKFIN
ncbi:MAG TPA: hypothetical protein DCS08_00670 [Candidatus Moranbacteria bacterium]|nr:hypothetical protein [Candidatus Moranbacteria bacterium]HBY10863.1 hypothetical protein [Candidatus Moranbacteria bacterium]